MTLTTTITIFLCGCIVALALRRLLLVALRWSGLVMVVVLAGRLALLADDRLAQPQWMTGAAVGAAVGFVVVGLLSYAFIYHALIHADERRAIDKAHEDAKRRRLW